MEDEDATLICDPEASNIDPKAGESLIVCYDGLLLGLRALKTAVERVERLYLRRPICATIPCTPVELSTVTVTGWSGENPTSVDIDWEMFRITPPEPDPGARWPTPSSRESPPIARPEIVDAPEFVAQREPFPFCGHADEDSVAAMGCFRDAIIAGRPAEMLDRFDVTGGTEVFRFDGQGLAIRYALYDDGWFEDAGNLVLGSAHGWSFHNWVDREPIP